MNANSVDIAPTVLAALGLRVPLDMEGKVIRDAFGIDPVVEREPPVKKVMEEHGEVYSEEDRRIDKTK